MGTLRADRRLLGNCVVSDNSRITALPYIDRIRTKGGHEAQCTRTPLFVHEASFRVSDHPLGAGPSCRRLSDSGMRKISTVLESARPNRAAMLRATRQRERRVWTRACATRHIRGVLAYEFPRCVHRQVFHRSGRESPHVTPRLVVPAIR